MSRWTPSAVATVTVSLTCNGDGVGFRGVVRPSAERGSCAFCRYPSKSWAKPDPDFWDSRWACSAVPVPETIITGSTSNGDGVAPESYKYKHSFKNWSQDPGLIGMRLGKSWAGGRSTARADR